MLNATPWPRLDLKKRLRDKDYAAISRVKSEIAMEEEKLMYQRMAYDLLVPDDENCMDKYGEMVKCFCKLEREYFEHSGINALDMKLGWFKTLILEPYYGNACPQSISMAYEAPIGLAHVHLTQHFGSMLQALHDHFKGVKNMRAMKLVHCVAHLFELFDVSEEEEDEEIEELHQFGLLGMPPYMEDFPSYLPSYYGEDFNECATRIFDELRIYVVDAEKYDYEQRAKTHRSK